MNICFVTVLCGTDDIEGAKTSISHKEKAPKEYDSYFVTDSQKIYNKLLNTNWIPKLVTCTGDNSQEEIDNMGTFTTRRYFNLQSKWVKIFPESFTDKVYDYVVYSDFSYPVNVVGSLKTIYESDPKIAMYLHRHTFVKNISNELQECLLQERYRKEEKNYRAYIQEEIAKGYSDTYNVHYQGGYIIYNLNHPEVYSIKKTWMEHIHRCGFEDQLSLNFVIQQYKNLIGDYIYDIEE